MLTCRQKGITLHAYANAHINLHNYMHANRLCAPESRKVKGTGIQPPVPCRGKQAYQHSIQTEMCTYMHSYMHANRLCA